MALKVFISYRRDDSAGQVGRIHDRLQQEFGSDFLFMDVDSVPLGVNFVKLLREEVASCDALLAIIGPNWIGARDQNGHLRLENPDDFVRIEISNALKRGIRVIPILLENTQVPTADQLPDDMKELAQRNGLTVRHTSFHGDMDRLIRELKGDHSSEAATRDASSGTLRGASQAQRFLDNGRNRALLGWGGGGIAVVIGALWAAYYFSPPSVPASPSTSVTANCGGIAVGGNVSGATITAGSVASADCAPRTK